MYRLISSRFPCCSSTTLPTRIICRVSSQKSEIVAHGPIGLNSKIFDQDTAFIPKESESDSFGLLASAANQANLIASGTYQAKRSIRLLDAELFVPKAEHEENVNEKTLDEVLQMLVNEGCDATDAMVEVYEFTEDSNLNFDDISPEEYQDKPTEGTPSIKRFDIDTRRTEFATIDEIKEALESKDIKALRLLFGEKKWPGIQGSLSRDVLELVLDKAVDYDEAALFFQDYAMTSSRVFVSDVLAFKLAIRAAAECADDSGANASAKALRSHRRVFMARPPSTEAKIELQSLIESCAKKSSMEDCIDLYETLDSNGYYADGNIFVRSYLSTIVSNGANYGDLVAKWKHLCEHFSSFNGLDLIMRRIYTDRVTEDKRCADVLKFATDFGLTPSHAVAEVVTALMVTNRETEAARILQRIFVAPHIFRQCLSRVLKEHGIAKFEAFVKLLGLQIYSEVRKGRKKVVEGAALPIQEEVNSKMLDSIFAHSGIGKAKKKYDKDLKKLKVNEKQLSELNVHIQRLWIQYARQNNELQAVDRLRTWCKTVQISLSPESEKQIRQLEDNLDRPNNRPG